MVSGAESSAPLTAPFPYFGGKRTVAAEVWARFGDVPNYVEPFCGTAAVLLARPAVDGTRKETINDINVFISNFWRATQADPDAVAHFADWPINEADLHARHRWLMLGATAAEFRERMKTDPDYFCAKTAGWWVWGASTWIAGGWCEGGKLFGADGGASNQVPKIDKVSGVNVMDGAAAGLYRKIPNVVHPRGMVSDSLGKRGPNPSGNGESGVHAIGGNARHVHLGRPYAMHATENIRDRIRRLRDRLRFVRVCCGSWDRVISSSVTTFHGVTGMFLDPPYSDKAGRDPKLYANDDLQVAHAVREWAIAHGDDPLFRIALCGYEGEHDMPASWSKYSWKTQGGYGHIHKDNNTEVNRKRERIWFSPHCLAARQGALFGEATA